MTQKPFSANLQRWVGVVPFFLFAILFLILPSMRLFVGSFTNNEGRFTFDNILQLFQQSNILSAYWLSIRISAVTSDCTDNKAESRPTARACGTGSSTNVNPGGGTRDRNALIGLQGARENRQAAVPRCCSDRCCVAPGP